MMKQILFATLTATMMMFGNLASADPDDNRGLIGVYVSPDDDGGMVIEGFIKNTPASRLNKAGEISRGDAIVKLAGKETDNIKRLTRARDRIPFGKEGKMVLRDRKGNFYYVWISRKDPSVARAAMARGYSAEEAQVEASDGFSYGGRGVGEDEADIRNPDGSEAKSSEGTEESEGASSTDEGSEESDDPDIR